MLQEYDKIIEEQLQANIIEQVPESYCCTDDYQESVHFPPHLAVIRKSRETTKVRIVYDGSAKFQQSNDHSTTVWEVELITSINFQYAGQLSRKPDRTYR